MIKTSAFAFQIPNILKQKTNTNNQQKTVIIKPPPPDFDFRTSILSNSTATISKSHPELLDLAQNGSLVVVEKSQYGPVPSWRSEFVEPEVIWILGTNHISECSSIDVKRVIRAVRPDNVVVELCRSRAGIMYTSSDGEMDKGLRSNEFSLSGNGIFEAVSRSINLGGQTALALRLLLALFSSKVSSDASRPFGDEFRAARKVAEEVGAQIVLGDRPIEITLERAWKALKWREKLRLIGAIINGITSSSDLSKNYSEGYLREKYDEPKSEDSSFQLYEQLSYSYSSLLPCLIYERDTYLAWSLKRSKAVKNCKKVVGVIGKGHMNGVIYALMADQGDLRFRDLAGYKPAGSSWVRSIVKDLVRDTVIGILLWQIYEQLKNGLV
ncbi:hypothetical protein LIER_24183 [Lithospermum erythrorhizon]|uniref:TraB domain-containing protein n=1 Tax=Lithospermum erythrorhizon TaxID=34254 RepID=A0AAV3R3G0_LITER